MPPRHDLLDQLGVFLRPDIHQEKGGFDVVFIQQIQDAQRFIPAPGRVKADGNLVVIAIDAVDGQLALTGYHADGIGQRAHIGGADGQQQRKAQKRYRMRGQPARSAWAALFDRLRARRNHSLLNHGFPLPLCLSGYARGQTGRTDKKRAAWNTLLSYAAQYARMTHPTNLAQMRANKS